MNYVLRKRIFNILNHMNFPPKMQISKPIDVSVFMFDLRMISMSSECEYDWCWTISACSTEYEVCDSFASLTRQQTSYSGSAGWYFRYQSIHTQITYTYPAMVLFLYKYDAQMCIWYIMLYCDGQGKWPFPVYFYLFKLLEFKSWINLTSGHFFYHYYCWVLTKFQCWSSNYCW